METSSCASSPSFLLFLLCSGESNSEPRCFRATVLTRTRVQGCFRSTLALHINNRSCLTSSALGRGKTRELLAAPGSNSTKQWATSCGHAHLHQMSHDLHYLLHGRTLRGVFRPAARHQAFDGLGQIFYQRRSCA